MEDNKELVLEDTENVEEQATEELVDGASVTPSEPEKKYTDADVDKIVEKKLYRQKQKLQDQYERKYGKVEELLKQGMETDSFEEAVDSIEKSYKERGININVPEYTNRELELLANAEAEEIINDGTEEIELETDRLASLIESGRASNKEKLIYNKLSTELKRQRDKEELESIGVNEDDLNDKEFKEFSKSLKDDMSIKDKYELFVKYKPKKEIKQIGSMKQDNPSIVKDHYTLEEISRLSSDDLDNPEVWEAVRKSMTES